ncbi:hypothetical protein [Flagellimonas onchidii]|uniref:hypothetical protein n=1 Tax=Flagellimonas onchidii TaxID=2562684 RepID=UPI0010A5AAD8|nr:hypothetical protein [Allomuricauda onchidii]
MKKHTNKKAILALLMVMFCAQSSRGQSYEGKGARTKIVEKTQFRLNLLSPGFDFEIGIFKNQTIVGGAGVGLAYYEEGHAFGIAATAQYRLYHNLNKRIKNDKVIAGNSGNYIAASCSIYFDQLIISTDIPSANFNIGYFGLVYGVQRTYENGFNFDVSVGPGYYLGDGVPSGYGPILNLKFGWVATKRKSQRIYFQ